MLNKKNFIFYSSLIIALFLTSYLYAYKESTNTVKDFNEAIKLDPKVSLLISSGMSYEDLNKENIKKKIYSKYKVPKFFYKDPSSLNIYSGYAMCIPKYSSDDKSEARKMIKDSLARPSNIKYRKIIKESETEKYFEFATKDIAFRVYKPSWIKWRKTDKLMDDIMSGKYMGYLGKKWHNGKNIKELCEYTWLIIFGNNLIGGAKVLRSVTYEEPEQFIHLLYITHVSYGDWGVSDSISLGLYSFKISKTDGKIFATQTLLNDFSGHQR